MTCWPLISASTFSTRTGRTPSATRMSMATSCATTESTSLNSWLKTRTRSSACSMKTWLPPLLLRQLRHQVFVVIQSQTHRGDGDAFLHERGAERPELTGGLRSHVGQAVGEQDHAIDAVLVEKLPQLIGPLAHAREQGGRAPRLDAADLLDHRFLVAELGGGNDHLDRRVVGDDGDDVVGSQSSDRGNGGVLGLGNLVSPASSPTCRARSRR